MWLFIGLYLIVTALVLIFHSELNKIWKVSFRDAVEETLYGKKSVIFFYLVAFIFCILFWWLIIAWLKLMPFMIANRSKK